MSILRLVRNFALLAVLALAAHAAAGADNRGHGDPHPHCGGFCNTTADCHGGCVCLAPGFVGLCVPKSH